MKNLLPVRDFHARPSIRPPVRGYFSAGVMFAGFAAAVLGTTALITPAYAVGEFSTYGAAAAAALALTGLDRSYPNAGGAGSVYTIIKFRGIVPNKAIGDIETTYDIYKIVYAFPQPVATLGGVKFVDPVLAQPNALGTNPANNFYGTGLAVTSNDVITSGWSDTDAGTFHATRWSLSGGVTQDLGTLLGSAGNSIAFGISGDGSTVVGWSNTTAAAGPGLFPSGQHAFRWTQPTGMVDLGSLAGVNGLSIAYGTNGDGTVVVGQTDMPNIGFVTQASQAFRWTQAAGMQALGNFGPNLSSVAYAVSSDGSTVVGSAEVLGGQHAIRWTQPTGITDIGTLPGFKAATATAVSGDGSVIVGYADPQTANNGATGWAFSNNSRPFRWTQPTGIQDLNTLATSGGVNMTGITFLTATGVTKDGQFIVGTGLFPDTPAGQYSGYFMRVCDATTTSACVAYNALVAGGSGTPIVGLTTPDSVQASVDQIGDARLRLMAQQYGMTAQLLGANQPIGTGTEVGIYGSAGSVGAGAFGRIAFGNGFTLLSGLAYQNQNYLDVRLQDAGLGALALRYVYGASGWWRPFAEVGGWTSFDGALSFSRNYLNGAGIATGSAATSGGMSYAYGRLGAAFSVLKADELAVSAEVGREWLRSGLYAEQMTQNNPFQGTALAAIDTLGAVKLRAQWTHVFSPKVDATVWGAGATTLDRSSPFQLMVPGVGILAPTRLAEASWGEYGARIGYKITAALTADAFIDGVAGNRGIGSNAHVGADLRYRF